MRLGVLGGTFDPIHFGHLRLAEEACDTHSLDRILFIPARVSPFKQASQVSASEHRLAMTELAVASNSKFEVSRAEIDREGPSYTVETLRSLRALYPHSELFLLLGTDAAAMLPEWYEADEIIRLAQVVVCARPGLSVEEVRAHMPEEYQERMLAADMLPIEISGTDLRARLEAGRSVRYLTPDPVVEYIERHQLYSAARAAGTSKGGNE